MQQQYPQRVKTILDDNKLRLSADPLPGGEGRPSMSIYYSGTGNPRIDVYTNMPGDKDNGRIRGDLDLPTFFEFLECLRELAATDAIPEQAYVIENKTKPWDQVNKRPGKEMVVATRLSCGKDKDGRIFIALTSYEQDRPRIRFFFGTGFFHSLGHPNGGKMSDAEVSRFKARGFVNMMGLLMAGVATRDWKEKEKKPDGQQGGGNRGGYNGGGGGGNRGGYGGGGGNARPAPAASSSDEGDDLPFN